MAPDGTILAVDDNGASLALLVDVLAAAGYRVRPAESGELALAAIGFEPPDLVLLDLHLGGIGGLEVCRRLKSDAATRAIPVILLSAVAEPEEWLEGLRLGAIDYLHKPFAARELLPRVANHLELSRATALLHRQTQLLLASNEQLRAEIDERQRAEAALHAVHRWEAAEQSLRLAIASMIEPEDLCQLVGECNRQVCALQENALRSVTLQVVNQDATDWVCLGSDLEPVRSHRLWSEGVSWRVAEDAAEPPASGPEILPDGHPLTGRGHAGDGSPETADPVTRVPFSHGAVCFCHATPAAAAASDTDLLTRLAGVMADGFRRFLDVVQRRQGEREAQLSGALRRVRHSALQMQREGDWGLVARLVIEELARFLPSDHSAVALGRGADRHDRVLAVSAETAGSAPMDWPRQPALREALETGVGVHCPHRRHPLFAPQTPASIHAMTAIPFSGGVLAVGGGVAGALPERDLYVLQQFAQALTEAHRHLEDVKAVEAHRRHALDLALQRLRNAVLQIEEPADWCQVALVLRRELNTLVRLDGCDLIVDDVDPGTWRTITVSADGTVQARPGAGRPAEPGAASGRPTHWRNRKEVAACGRGYGTTIGSAVEVPFAGGAMVICSELEEAYTDRDVALLTDFADAIGDGHRRLLGITERRRNAAALRAAHARLEALWGIASLTDASLDEVTDHIVASIARLTQSTYGFYGYMSETATALTIHAWSAPGSADGSPTAVPQRFPLDGGGVWSAAVRRREPVVVDAGAAAGQTDDGLPPGHGPLTSLLVVPLVSRGRVTTVAGVANRPQGYGPDEIRDVQAFLSAIHGVAESKRLAAVVEAQRLQALEANRLHTLGEMAAGVAHELNQPLNGIRAFAEAAVYGITHGWPTTADETADTFQEIIGQVDRITAIIDHMRVFARDASPAGFVAVNLADVVAGALKLVGAELRGHGVQVVVDIPGNIPPVAGYQNSLEQVVINLLVNARDALFSRRDRERADTPWKPRIDCTVREDPDRHEVCLAVSDNGDGIAQEVLSRIFDPFFTTKAVGEGTGLGLAIVRATVDQHQGRVAVTNRPGDGVTFTVALPALGPTSG
jgi:signal transduction histidine kinase/DNA-binding response OmpR family regulator